MHNPTMKNTAKSIKQDDLSLLLRQTPADFNWRFRQGFGQQLDSPSIERNNPNRAEEIKQIGGAK
mgnify:CR=1 FL=1